MDPQERSIVEVLKETEKIIEKQEDLSVSQQDLSTTLKVISMMKEKA
jgi:hypothetical protein